MKSAEVMKNALQKHGTVRIKLLGDSITHGSGGTGYKQSGEPITEGFRRNPDGYCWAKLFKEYMESEYNCEVTNNGCSGTTIEYTISHLDELVSKDDDLIICTIGTNNRHVFFEDAESRPDRDELMNRFYDNILILDKRLKELGKNAVFVANIPASATNENNDGQNYWRILHMWDIDALYKKAEAECGFGFISLYDLFLEYCEKEGIFFETLLFDGLHPNDEGYRIMYELLVREMEV